MRKHNFTSWGMMAERKSGSGTSVIWQSWQNGSAQNGISQFWQLKQSASVEAELQIFDIQGRVEVRKRNFRSLAVKTKRKYGSRTSDLWQSSQIGSVEAELYFDSLSLPMLTNNSTDCYNCHS